MQAIRYDESFSVGSDLDLALRMANMGCRIEHTGSYLTLRRFHHENVTITNLGGQLSVGQRARHRIGETFGNGYEWRLKETAKKAPPAVCRNGISKDFVIGLIPRYTGVWRLLVSLNDIGHVNRNDFGAGLDQVDTRGDSLVIDAETDASDEIRLFEADVPAEPPRQALIESTADRSLQDRAARLAGLLKGDVGVIDCGIDPGFFFISEPIKGAAKALQIRHSVEGEFAVPVEMVPDVEYRRRHMTRFDWNQLAAEEHASRLLSRPTKDLSRVLSALARLPGNTMLRAMTSVLADFNCEDQLYRLVTVPIPGPEKQAAVRRVLEDFTGEAFDALNEIGLLPQNGRPS